MDRIEDFEEYINQRIKILFVILKEIRVQDEEYNTIAQKIEDLLSTLKSLYKVWDIVRWLRAEDKVFSVCSDIDIYGICKYNYEDDLEFLKIVITYYLYKKTGKYIEPYYIEISRDKENNRLNVSINTQNCVVSFSVDYDEILKLIEDLKERSNKVRIKREGAKIYVYDDELEKVWEKTRYDIL